MQLVGFFAIGKKLQDEVIKAELKFIKKRLDMFKYRCGVHEKKLHLCRGNSSMYNLEAFGITLLKDFQGKPYIFLLFLILKNEILS